MSIKRPILIYDGHCNLCVNFIKTVEPFNDEGNGAFKVSFVPYQKADALIESYKLDREALKSAFHLIDANGSVFKAGQAVDKLADVYPILKLGSPFFMTPAGEALYGLIAQNRYSIFGCRDECYVSEFYESEQK